MASRKPLVLVDGVVREMPIGDTLDPTIDLAARFQGSAITPTPVHPKPFYILPTYDNTLWTPDGVTLGNSYLIPPDGGAVEKCQKVTMNTSGVYLFDISPGINISGKVLFGEYLVHPGTPAAADDWKNIGTFDVDFYSGGATDTDHRLRFNILDQRDVADLDASPFYTGWHCIAAPIEYGHESKGPLFDATNITRIRVNTNNVEASTPSISPRLLAIVEPLIHGGVVLVVDNFNEAVPLMANYATEKGVKLNLSLITEYHDTAGDATLAQMLKCRDDGHFIFNHTKYHVVSTTAEQALSEFEVGREDMETLGFGYGSKVMSVVTDNLPTFVYDTVYPLTHAMYHRWEYPQKLWTPYYPASRHISQSCLLDNKDSALAAIAAAVTLKSIAVCGFHGTF
jgi:hypothetical protein